MTIAPSSRVQLLNTPVAAPGVCALCGSGNKPVVDFGKQLDWYGAVYFCVECITEISKAIGFVPVDGFDSLHTEYRELKIKYDQLLLEYETVKNALSKLLASDIRSDSPVVEPPSYDIPSVEVPDIGDVTNDETVSGNSETKQSASVEGLDDIFDDSDLE